MFWTCGKLNVFAQFERETKAMKAIDAIRSAFGFCDLTFRSIQDMRKTALTQPGPYGGNHAMWIVGHLAVAEGRLHKILLGEPNPVEHWKPLFDWETTPKTDPSAYPPFDEVVQTFLRLRAKTLALLNEIGNDGLDRPTKSPPPGLEASFGTVGQAVMTIAMHQVFHNGQASVARRASGKTPVFVPSDTLRAF
jgi:DinB superfamily